MVHFVEACYILTVTHLQYVQIPLAPFLMLDLPSVHSGLQLTSLYV